MDNDRFLVEFHEGLKSVIDLHFANRALFVTIHQTIFPITQEALRQVFSPYGCVEKITPIQNSFGVQFIVQYQGYGAIAAMSSLQGRNIYDGCCQMDIQLHNDARLTDCEMKQVSTIELSTEVECSDSLLEPPLVQDVVLDLPMVAREVGSRESKVFDKIHVHSDEVKDDQNSGIERDDSIMQLMVNPIGWDDPTQGVAALMMCLDQSLTMGIDSSMEVIGAPMVLSTGFVFGSVRTLELYIGESIHEEELSAAKIICGELVEVDESKEVQLSFKVNADHFRPNETTSNQGNIKFLTQLRYMDIYLMRLMYINKHVEFNDPYVFRLMLMGMSMLHCNMSLSDKDVTLSVVNTNLRIFMSKRRLISSCLLSMYCEFCNLLAAISMYNVLMAKKDVSYTSGIIGYFVVMSGLAQLYLRCGNLDEEEKHLLQVASNVKACISFGSMEVITEGTINTKASRILARRMVERTLNFSLCFKEQCRRDVKWREVNQQANWIIRMSIGNHKISSLSHEQEVIDKDSMGQLNEVEFTLQGILQSQLKTTVIAWVSDIILTVHVLINWVFIYKFGIGIVGVAINLDLSWRLFVLGLSVYAIGDGCSLPWTGFSTHIIFELWNFFKLYLVSGIMLFSENYYYRTLIIVRWIGHVNYIQSSLSLRSMIFYAGDVGTIWRPVINLVEIGCYHALKASYDIDRRAELTIHIYDQVSKMLNGDHGRFIQIRNKFIGNPIKCTNKGHILVMHIINSKRDPWLVLSSSVQVEAIIIADNSVGLKALAKSGSRIKIPIISLFAADSSLPFSKYPYLLQTGATLVELFGWRTVILMFEALLAMMKKSSMFLLVHSLVLTKVKRAWGHIWSNHRKKVIFESLRTRIHSSREHCNVLFLL